MDWGFSIAALLATPVWIYTIHCSGGKISRRNVAPFLALKRKALALATGPGAKSAPEVT